MKAKFKDAISAENIAKARYHIVHQTRSSKLTLSRDMFVLGAWVLVGGERYHCTLLHKTIRSMHLSINK